MSLISFLLTCVLGASIGFVVYSLFPKGEKQAQNFWENYKKGLVFRLDQLFLQDHIPKVGRYVLASTLTFLFFGFFLTFGFGWINLLFTLLFGVFGFFLVENVLKILVSNRLNKINHQIVDGLNLLANSLKSGLNVDQAIGVLVKEMPNPLSQEFNLVLSQKNIGLTLDEALEKLIERVPSEDLGVAMHSVLILRETGGDLAETFEVIATTIRERRKVTGKIQSLTAQGKMQGTILFLMPFAFGLMLYLLNPGYLEPMFTTQMGWIMILLMLILQTVGLLWILKIVKIEV